MSDREIRNIESGIAVPNPDTVMKIFAVDRHRNYDSTKFRACQVAEKQANI